MSDVEETIRRAVQDFADAYGVGTTTEADLLRFEAETREQIVDRLTEARHGSDPSGSRGPSAEHREPAHT